MKLKDMVESGLKAGGYDGLISEDGECGCPLSDLAPCGSPGLDCEGGYAGRSLEGLPMIYRTREAAADTERFIAEHLGMIAAAKKYAKEHDRS